MTKHVMPMTALLITAANLFWISTAPAYGSNGQVMQVRGNVQIRTQGSSRFRSPYIGQSIKSGDLFRASPGAVAMIQCPNRIAIVVPADGNTRGLNQLCPTGASRVRGSEPTFQQGNPLSGTDAEKPYILTPRRSIVSGNSPVIRWHAPDSGRYRLSLTKILWVQDLPSDTLTFSPSNLTPGSTSASYRLVVEAYQGTMFLSRQVYVVPAPTDRISRQGLQFSWSAVPKATRYLISVEQSLPLWEIDTEKNQATYPDQLDPGYYTIALSDSSGIVDQQQILVESQDDADKSTAKALRELGRLDTIESPDGQPLPKASKALAAAKIYGDHFMFADAIAQLSSLAEDQTTSPFVQQQLGDFYQKVGLTTLATDYYTKALELAEAAGDTEIQALLKAALNELSSQ